jgi:hypothetical protein
MEDFLLHETPPSSQGYDEYDTYIESTPSSQRLIRQLLRNHGKKGWYSKGQ